MSEHRRETVLVVGSGGREHALVWRLSMSSRVRKVIAVPGNDGFSLSPLGCELERWTANFSLSGDALQAEFLRIAEAAKSAGVSLVVVGPDNPLADGMVDVLERAGLACFGPSAKAAQLEASKAFAKEVMVAAKVPTARYFKATQFSEAQKILKSVPWKKQRTSDLASPLHSPFHFSQHSPESAAPSWVIKADGLALGKGVRVCSTFEEAQSAAQELIEISGSLVIEEFLQGEEVSWLAFCDGETCALLEPARDYKRLQENGIGPNTGGMGAFSPVPGIPSAWKERVRKEVFLPTLNEMKKRGTPFKGVLYAGLMCDFSTDQYWVLEFNARFGDPETQVLLPRMADDLYTWCEAVALGKVATEFGRDVHFINEVCVGVVGAANGYPEKPEKGKVISGLGFQAKTFSDETPLKDSASLESGFLQVPNYFYAGVSQRSNAGLFTSGGRVFLALGMAENFELARNKAYRRMESLGFEGMQFRRDIAKDLSADFDGSEPSGFRAGGNNTPNEAGDLR